MEYAKSVKISLFKSVSMIIEFLSRLYFKKYVYKIERLCLIYETFNTNFHFVVLIRETEFIF